MRTPSTAILSLCVAALLSSCALVQSSPSALETRGADSRIDESDLPVDSRITSMTRKELVDGLAVAWEVPSEPTDGFIIRYGTSPQALDAEISVGVSELRREHDPVYGSVYRFIIEDVPPGKPLFVSIAARRGNLISEFTPTMPEGKHGALDY